MARYDYHVLTSASGGCNADSSTAASPCHSSKHELVQQQPCLITASRSAQYTAITQGCQSVLNLYATVDVVCIVPACRRWPHPASHAAPQEGSQQ